MKEAGKQEQTSLPPCPNPSCSESHVVRNGSHRGRQRYCCRTCKTYFGDTQGTPMYGLKTEASEVAHALLIVMRRGSLRAAEELIEQAVTITVQRTHQRELHWFSDGWQGYGSILERAYRKRVLTGKRGRPPLVVPETVSLTQTVKHRDEHGHLLWVETRAALGVL